MPEPALDYPRWWKELLSATREEELAYRRIYIDRALPPISQAITDRLVFKLMSSLRTEKKGV